MAPMKRVVILGRGGAGKSTLAARLGEITGLPVIELDKSFWRAGQNTLEAMPTRCAGSCANILLAGGSVMKRGGDAAARWCRELVVRVRATRGDRSV